MSIIQNAVKITEGKLITYLVSAHRHDFNAYSFQDGSNYAVDGGKDYIRRGYKFIKDRAEYDIEVYNLDELSTPDEINNRLLWGTYDKVNKEVKYLPLKDLTLEHLKAIIRDAEKRPAMFPERHINVAKYWAEEKGKE